MDSFRELARFCVERYKNSLNNEYEHYIDTLYVSIENDIVKCSTTPHLLSQADKCILIHSKKQQAVTNWYTWYYVEYIDDEGAVTDGMLGNGFRLYTDRRGSYDNQRIFLCHNGFELYSCPAPFEDKMQKVWNLYLRARRIQSQEAFELMADLIERDETILELEGEIANLKFTNILLEKQKKQYRSLLKKIEEMVDQLK